MGGTISTEGVGVLYLLRGKGTLSPKEEGTLFTEGEGTLSTEGGGTLSTEGGGGGSHLKVLSLCYSCLPWDPWALTPGGRWCVSRAKS